MAIVCITSHQLDLQFAADHDLLDRERLRLVEATFVLEEAVQARTDVLR